ncbi:poly-gamma-glutamate biosynthesis protein PgsC/CapC [Roseomonas sp. GCM10028921]
MSGWVLPIFPEGGLASSVITTVWVGVWVVAFFNLRFGWVFSGLVVPGYLVPLLIVKPFAAAVVVFEAAVTYLIVWAFSERLSSGHTWSSLFGRDRFMGLVLASIAVRLAFDVWALPLFGAFLNDHFGIAFDWRNNLHSFGLIVVSLMANQFWKPGLLKGLGSAFVTVGLTYLLVRYGLMEFTNFRISGIAYLYEGWAASILASPKAYIILIATAFIASQMNLRYAWEFGGILIPALIALQWYQPLKIVTSFVEAFVIYGLGALALRAPMFADVTMEGARKVLLFFNVGFTYKLLLGWAVVLLGIEVKQSDMFGFGYLLATLMAIKMYDKAMLLRFTRSTLQISLAGAAAGTAIGFLLLITPAGLGFTAAEPHTDAAAPVRRENTSLAFALAQQSVGLYGGSIPGQPTSLPDPSQLASFRRAAEILFSTEGAAEAELPGRAASFLSAAGYRLELLHEGWLLLAEAEAGRGWGSFALRPRSTSPLLLAVPNPLTLPSFPAAAALIAANQDARAIAITGPSGGPTDSQPLGRSAALQPIERAFTEVALSGGLGLLELKAGAKTRLSVAGPLPKGLDAVGLSRALDTNLAPEFGPPPESHPSAASATAGFATLQLNGTGLGRLLSRDVEVATVEDRRIGLSAFLLDRLSEPDAIAPAGSGAYKPPSLAELRYLDVEVLTPLLHEAQAGTPANRTTALAPAARAASAVGYTVSLVRSGPEGDDLHALLTDATLDRHRGSYAFRVGADRAPFVVQVPRPLAEVNSMEFGLSLYDQIGATALLIAGADPRALADGSADPLQPQAPPSVFNLVGQVLLREAVRAPLMTVQARALGASREGTLPPEDALLALDRLPLGGRATGPLAARLLGTVERLGLSVRPVDGSAATAGYGIGWSAPALYLSQAGPEKELGVLWLSPLARLAFAQRTEARLEEAQFSALGIPTVALSPAAWLSETPPGGAGALRPAGLRASLADYIERRDILALRAAQRRFSGLRFRRLASPETRQTFLAVETAVGAPLALANLTPLDAETALEGAQSLGRFLEARAGWLLLAPEALAR